MLKYDFEKNLAVVDLPSIWKIDKQKVSVTTVTDTSIVEIPNEGCVTILVGNLSSFGNNEGSTTATYQPGTNTNSQGSGSSTEEITYTPPTQTDSTPAMGTNDLLYTVGLISDIHYCVPKDKRELISSDWGNNSDNGSYFEEDLRHIIVDTFSSYNVDFIASPGDVATYDINDFIKFTKDYTVSKPFYCAMGNHDHLITYGVNKWTEPDQGVDGSRWTSVSGTNKSGGKSLWNCPGSLCGSIPTNQKSNMSYYITKNNGNDIYIFLQTNFGVANNTSTKQVHPHNQLVASNAYVQQMVEYCGINTFVGNESNFNFQYYLPQDLMWLKNIIENNTNKRIFVFSHYFLPNKAGGGNKYVPGASTELMGITFHFLNKLNKTHKNVTWFSGHSHLSWMDNSSKGLHWTNLDYDYIKPTSSDNATILTNYKNSYYRVTTGNKPYNRDSAKLASTNKTGWNIHLPSMSRPVMNGSSQLPGCEAAIMFVYKWGVEIKKLGYTRNSNGTYTSYVNSIPDNSLMIYNDGTGVCNDTAPEISEQSVSNNTEGINIVFHNNTGTKVALSGKFTMYAKTPNSQDWGSTTTGIAMHFAAPIIEDGWPKWLTNPYTIEAGQTLSIPITRVTEYVGQNATRVVDWTNSNCEYYGMLFVTTDSPQNIAAQNANMLGGNPAIKAGVAEHKAGDTHVSNTNGFLHIPPITDNGNSITIQKGRTYDIYITTAISSYKNSDGVIYNVSLGSDNIYVRTPNS